MITKEYVYEILEKAEPMTPDEERDVFAYYDKNKSLEIKQKIVMKNLGLIQLVAKKFASTDVEYEDLKQEGVLALYRAFDGFNYKRGYKFSTYAYNWVYSYLSKYVGNHSRTIRIPINLYEDYRAIVETQKKSKNEQGDYLNEDELSLITGLSIERIREVLKIEKLSANGYSLDMNIETEEGHVCIGDIIEDEKSEEVYDSAIYSVDMKNFWKTIKGVLSKKEFDVIRCRMGLGLDKPMTLDAVGKKYNITRERVRQIETRAIKKLRHPSLNSELDKYKNCIY